MSVEQATVTTGEQGTSVHDVSDLTPEGVRAFAESAVDGEVHVERKGGRTLLVVE